MAPPTVLLDAFGTLVHFGDPVPLLRDGLRARLGLEVTAEAAGAAMRGEIAHYRAHHDRAVDAAALAQLRRDCGRVVRGALGPEAADADLDAVTASLVGAIRFEPYAEVPETLAALRSAGARLVVVSNWDVSLHEVLAQTGLRPLVDAVVVSAQEGVAKPDPRIFTRALARVNARAEDAVHVGDSLEEDVAGARAAGIRAVLLARDGAPAPPGIPALRRLDGLLPLRTP
jgi:putative hydrolase of the HAD superfamily